MMVDLLQGGFELFEAGPHGGQQFEAFVGDFHPPAVAPKQRHLDIRLQRLDLLADGCGRDIERIGSGREIQVRGHRLEYPQGSQWQSVVGGWHLKFSLTDCQTLRLLRIGAWSNVLSSEPINPSEYIMNQIHLVATLAQRLLAVTIVFTRCL